MTKQNIPYCPDPGNMVLVKTATGYHWRKKRGTVRPVVLNAAFAENVDLSRIAGPIAAKIVARLQTFTRGLATGRMVLKVTNALRRSLKEERDMNFSFMNGMELQEQYPLQRLLLSSYRVTVGNGEVVVIVDVEPACVARHNTLVTDFYLEAVLLQSSKNGEQLLVEHATTGLYPIDGQQSEEAMLRLWFADVRGPWMVLLKVSCMEGVQPAVHPKNYGMKVVAVG